MKIVVENHIPYISGLLEPYAQVLYLETSDITASALKDADVLITRTRTRCDEALLSGSRVRMIGTATIGTDHIDLDYCRRAGIKVVNAPGCNAPAVAQWVLSTVGYWLQKEGIAQPRGLVMGVVGVGHVGSIVAIMLVVGGIFMLFCDRIFNKGSEDNKVSVKRAFIIGCWQCLSVIPGTSRSMATIVGGMQQKLTRKNAAEFSFFLAVPTMAGATLLDLLDMFKEGTSWATSNNIMLLIVGCVIAFVVAMLAMKWFVGFLTKYGFKFFGWYRIVIGAIILILLLTGHSLSMVD